MTLPFENDTRIIVKKLAKRSLQADKRRNIFLILTIILTQRSYQECFLPSLPNKES